MAGQHSLITKPDMQQLQTSILLDWQNLLDQLLDQSSIWEVENLGGGSGGPKEPELVVADNIQAPQNHF
jgi:hypothetical protein